MDFNNENTLLIIVSKLLSPGSFIEYKCRYIFVVHRFYASKSFHFKLRIKLLKLPISHPFALACF